MGSLTRSVWVWMVPTAAGMPTLSRPSQRTSRPTSTPALGLPDFARGPDNNSGGNVVNGNVSTIEVPNQGAAGIPITLYNRANVTDVVFTVTYNPSLIANIGAYGNAGSDATDQNSNLVLVSNVGGVATFHYTDSTAITANPDAPLVLGDITAIVPSTGTLNAKALYQVKQQLQLGGTGASFSINGVTNANWAVSTASMSTLTSAM